jgi:hypothetical protein
MDIAHWPLARLLEHPKNYRVHTEKQLLVLMESLQCHQQAKPIVITSEGVILAGHGIAEAARRLGWDEIACTVYRGNSPEAFLVMDNRAGALAEDDSAKLSALLAEIEREEGLSGTGYFEDDVAQLLAQAEGKTPPHGDGFSVAEALADPASAGLDEECRPGDLWKIGRHRLLCGDPLDPVAIDRLMGGARAQTILFTPPYMAWCAHSVEVRRGRHLDHLALLPAADDATLICLHGTREFPAALEALGVAGWQFQRLLWRPVTNERAQEWLSWVVLAEVILLATRGDGCWNDGKHRHPDLYDGLPVDVWTDLFTRTCYPGGIVYVPCAGDGIAVLSGERSGRTVYGMVDPDGCALAIARYEAETGESAVREEG